MAVDQLSTIVEHLHSFRAKQDAARMTDGDLLNRYVRKRDETAFEALLRRHGPMVMGVCRRVLHNPHDAEDAFQATFLVLVRKASSLRSPGTVGNWLYGVAYRTALEARKLTTKRRAKEAEVLPRTETQEDAWADLRALLDRELEQLPEKYRTVIVLCDLEGMTRKEAALRLGWPEGTVASRLASARTLLAKRLSRHGLTVSSGALAVMLSNNASAGAGTTVVSATIQAATKVAAGQATAGGISTKVATLMEGVLKTMLLTKLKMAAVLLVVACVGIVGGLAFRTQAAEEPTFADEKTKPREAATTRSEAPDEEKGSTKGLKLTLSADKTVTYMKPNGKDAVTVKLKLTFTNVSDKPIKLNAYDLQWRMAFSCSGPSPDSVHTIIEEVERPMLPPPVAKDFPLLEPGKSWSPEWAYSFPGDILQEGKSVSYALLKPGMYKLRFTYKNQEEGYWTGSLESNELELKVREKEEAGAKPEGGKPVKGLKLTLSADSTETHLKPDGSDAVPVKLKLTFTNVSDKPIKLNAYDLQWRMAFRCSGPSPDCVHTIVLYVDRIAPAPAAKDFPLLEPGKSWSPEWTQSFPGDIPHETAKIVGYSLSKPGMYKLRFTHENSAEGYWTGSLESNELELKVREKEEAGAKPEGGKPVKGQFGMAEVVEQAAFENVKIQEAKKDEGKAGFEDVDDKINTLSVRAILDEVDAKNRTISLSIPKTALKGKTIMKGNDADIDVAGDGTAANKPTKLVNLLVAKDAVFLSGKKQIKIDDLKAGMHVIVQLSSSGNIQIAVCHLSLSKDDGFQDIEIEIEKKDKR